jgi:outer membrane protein assembly factor BamA
VTDIEFRGFDVLPAEELARLRATLPLRPEQPLDRQLEIASRERALNALRDGGYPYATVSLTEIETAPRQRRLVLDATPNVLAHFGIVDIRGEATVGENVIRRQLAVQPGDRFSRVAMRDAQRRLYGLELFEFVNVEALEEPVLMNEDVPIRITVAEGKHQRVTTGIGYGTEEHARARLRWEHHNVFGGAQRAGVEGKWSSLDRGLRVDYREPFFLVRNFSIHFDGQAWDAEEPVYRTSQIGGRVTLRHQPNLQTFWTVSLTNEFQSSSITREALEDFTIRDELIALGLDPTDGTSEGTLSALAVDISRNTTANLLDPRSGYVLSGHFEQAARWLRGTYSYRTVTAEGRHYLPLGERVVVANRIRAGTIKPSADDEANVPFYRRFFLGGASSIRGWGRFEVSPLSGFGFPIGGLSMIDGSSEVRVPLWGKFGAVAFFDYGNVWPGAAEFDLRDMRRAIGPGLRYTTPIGPVRFDLGYQLNPIEGLLVDGAPQKRPLRIHFSIGQAF